MHMPGAFELLVVLMVALLLFGGQKLPEIGRSLGRSIHEFKKALSGEEPENKEQQKTDASK